MAVTVYAGESVEFSDHKDRHLLCHPEQRKLSHKRDWHGLVRAQRD